MPRWVAYSIPPSSSICLVSLMHTETLDSAHVARLMIEKTGEGKRRWKPKLWLKLAE